jgi:hypothetical protein
MPEVKCRFIQQEQNTVAKSRLEYDEQEMKWHAVLSVGRDHPLRLDYHAL